MLDKERQLVSPGVTLESDVLVIGGGMAGCRAALRARKLGSKVTLVDKAFVSRSGATPFCHAILAPPTDNEVEAWLKEIVESGEFLVDQEWMGALLRDHGQRLGELEALGVEFERGKDGCLNRTLARGQKVCRSIHFDGARVLSKLRRALESQGVKLIERTVITDLLTSDGLYPTGERVTGAVGFHGRTGQFLVFPAKTTIVATGPFSSDLNFNYIDNCTGEGTAAAYRAGAELMEMQYAQGGSINYFAHKLKVIGQSTLQGQGARIVNRLGERIMERYAPDLKERASLGIVSRCMAKEALEGRGPCYFDLTHLKDEDLDHMRRILPVLMRGFDNVGIDLKKEPVECTPLTGIMATGPGAGIRVNPDARTSVAGLYACGNATKLPNGAANLASIPQAYASFSGYRAGENAAREASQVASPRTENGQVRELYRVATLPLTRKSRVTAGDVFYEIMKTMAPARYSLFKREDRIEESLGRARYIRDELLPQVSARDSHELVKATGARSITLLVELLLLSALERTECRGPHYREDYPYRDDADWLKWVIVKSASLGQPVVETVPVPFEKYPVQPVERKRIPHPVQIKL